MEKGMMISILSVDTRRGRGRARLACSLLVLGLLVPQLGAQEPPRSIDLTLERMVELTLSSSYQVRFLNMGVDQTRLRLGAERARLKSNLSLDLSAPDFQSISESKWNSGLGRNEIVHENSRRWEAQLSLRQPVLFPFLGYTNGYLSLNNRVYRYLQVETDGEKDLTYYNRYFLRYTQPLFQTNSLKNSVEGAELNLVEAEIDFNEDVMEVVSDVSEQWLRLFENAYRQRIYADYVSSLDRAHEAAQAAALGDAARAMDADQVRVELANARERLQSTQSQFRLQTSRLKARLNLPESVVISLDPVIDIRPVQVDVEQATRLARDLTPRLRKLDIARRESEIQLDETRGRGGFRMNLELTYGREVQDPVFADLWQERSDITYTVDLNASVPIWDWGERRSRIEAQQIGVQRTRLQIEQAEAQIVSNVLNEIRNLEELESRALAMQQNLSLAAGVSRQSLERYREGSISALDLLQSLRRETDTASNFLEAYVGWQRAIQELQELTYYDFENGLPVLQRFGLMSDSGEIVRTITR